MGSMYEEILERGERRGLEKGLLEGLQMGRKEGGKEGERKGLQKGEQKGRLEEKRSGAARMLAMGKFSVEEIAEVFSLGLDEVRALAEGRGV